MRGIKRIVYSFSLVKNERMVGMEPFFLLEHFLVVQWEDPRVGKKVGVSGAAADPRADPREVQWGVY